jgi:hypothetical protein
MSTARVIYPGGTGWLSADELAVLAVLARGTCSHTPAQLAVATGKTWQHCARVAGVLVRLGLASKCSLPKQTTYEITSEGLAVLKAGTP